MNIVYSAAAAVVTGIVFYILSGYAGTKYELELERKNDWVTDIRVIVIASLLTVVMFVYFLRKFETIRITEAILTIIIFTGMGILSVTDLKKKTVPNRIILILLICWAVINGAWLLLDLDTGLQNLAYSVLGGIVAGAIFLLCYLVSRGKLGAGDVKLSFVMGLYLTSLRIMGAILYGCILCLVISLIFVWRKKLTMKDGVPLVPFLTAGMLLTYLIV
ncbi:MAG: A24 family peptidase [Lachnospiraceae bacterium]|nr:A24 family peptidase [Lachnospiraceae bacterium]